MPFQTTLVQYGVPLYLVNPPARYRSSHVPKDRFPVSIEKRVTRNPATLWHLMQTSSFLRKVARPFYIAYTAHFVCVSQLEAYQASIFCEPNSRPEGSRRRVSVHLKLTSVPMTALLRFQRYHDDLDICPSHWDGQQGRKRAWREVGRLITARNEPWMISLLERTRDFRLDGSGDVRLILDPYYFAVQPDLRDLRSDLAQLRLVTKGALYILLMPRRKRHRHRQSKNNPSIDVADLRHRHWKSGKRLGHIQSVSRTEGLGKDMYGVGLDVVPSKTFVASGRSVWEIGAAWEGLKTVSDDSIWLRMFPSVRDNIEDVTKTSTMRERIRVVGKGGCPREFPQTSTSSDISTEHCQTGVFLVNRMVAAIQCTCPLPYREETANVRTDSTAHDRPYNSDDNTALFLAYRPLKRQDKAECSMRPNY
ncbi:hypothetical protein S40288_11087 [Stachybotrys chartarum IBT 40288]|nr:hypothetical protein S40288_11087 [Stachybotrys chartarum IBT 40288]